MYMPELIQLKIVKDDERKIQTPGVKKELGAFDIRIQLGDRNHKEQVKVKIGNENRAQTEYIPPNVLITITGENLATREKINRTLEKHGIRIISSGKKISW